MHLDRIPCDPDSYNKRGAVFHVAERGGKKPKPWDAVAEARAGDRVAQ